MLRFIRSLTLAALIALALITPTFAATVTPTHLFEGILYSVITEHGDILVIRGDGQNYNVSHVNVRIPLVAIPTSEQKAMYFPNQGDPENFYVYTVAPAELIESWVSSDSFKGNHLKSGSLYLVIMRDGNRVALIGDGRSYDVHHFIGLIPLAAIPTEEQQALLIPTNGDPETSHYSPFVAPVGLIESLRSN